MELWDLYTNEREKTGLVMKRGEPMPKGYCRLVVHICVFNTAGELLIQHRHDLHAVPLGQVSDGLAHGGDALLKQLTQPPGVCTGQTQNRQRPFYDAARDILISRKVNWSFYRGTLHGKDISASLKVIVGQNRSAHNGKIRI